MTPPDPTSHMTDRMSLSFLLFPRWGSWGGPNVPGKRGRPRKLKLSKAGRPPKNTGRSLTSTKNTLTGPGSTFPDVKPDLEDVDGVLFVSFESKVRLSFLAFFLRPNNHH